MEAKLFTKMLSDKSLLDLKKMGYKYPQTDMGEFLALLKVDFCKTLPIKDFDGQALRYMDSIAQVRLSAAKVLLTPQRSGAFGVKAMEEEIVSTLAIEQIDTSRDSVRKILSGHAPTNEGENRIYGMKKGLEFIADETNRITEENIHHLYQMTAGDFLEEEDRLLPGNLYRHDSVFVVGSKVEHTGLHWSKLDAYMAELVAFINSDDQINDLLKAAMIHFYIAYLHPYFDGNGRMARLMHLWYLVQRGYSSALFIPLSNFVERSRKAYHDAYTQVEENAAISGFVDMTPFLIYFVENVYHKLKDSLPASEISEQFRVYVAEGKVTEKEVALWQFVLSVYGHDEFSTKMLERDFGNAAYATIRSFVLKFEKLGLLSSQKYGQRIRYQLAG